MTNDLKSPYCLVPFGQLSSKPDGKLRPCCASGDRLILKEKSFLKAWRSEEMNNLRETFNRGESVPGCAKCIEDEKLDKKSTRLWKNESWGEITKHNVTLSQKNAGEIKDGMPISFELRLGNLCNLSCRMCNALYSSRFQKDLERDDKWKESPLLNSLYESSLRDSKKIDNWYQQDEFWRELSLMSNNLRSLYFSGGEPLLIEEMKILLKHLVKTGQARRVKVRFDTNLMQVPKETFDLLKEFKEVAIGVSLDAIGDLLETVRFGSSWELIKRNLFQVRDMGAPFTLSISALASSMNVHELDKLYQFIKVELSKDIMIVLDFLNEPKTLSAKSLGQAAKKVALEKIDRIKTTLGEILSPYELTGLHSLERLLNQDSEVTRADFEEHATFLDRLHSSP